MKLYYYTTTETMRYILSGGNIFATNMKYMNDSDEYVNGLREVRELLTHKKWAYQDIAKRMLTDQVYREFSTREVNSFSISFTTARDLLSQWSMYAKESGVSLGMVFDKDSYEFSTYKEDGTREANYNLLPKQVFYFTKEAMEEKCYRDVGNKIIAALCEEIEQDIEMNDIIKSLWAGIAPYVKRADFGAEEEYRLVFDSNNGISYIPRVDYRSDKNVLKPYLDVSLTEGWPITEITVGPGFNQASVFNSLIYFLRRSKIKIPIADCEQMSKRILEYIKGSQSYGVEAQTVKELCEQWNIVYEEFKINNNVADYNNINRLYTEFNSFLLNNLVTLKVYGENSYLSPAGILLRKSKIPYIF